jgi:hypothetical protein
MTLMVPALFGVSVSQLNLLLDTVLASFLPTGSVSWLYYSDRLTELPLGVFAIAVATVIMPTLSAHSAAARAEDFTRDAGLGRALVLLVGGAGGPRPDYPGGADSRRPCFTTAPSTERDIYMAGLSLRAYSLGLCAFMLIKVLAPGFYARQDMQSPRCASASDRHGREYAAEPAFVAAADADGGRRSRGPRARDQRQCRPECTGCSGAACCTQGVFRFSPTGGAFCRAFSWPARR